MPKKVERVTILDCQIDDMTPESLGFVLERLIADERVLDAYVTPIQMKKNRPGHLVTVLTDANYVREIGRMLLEETTTFGVRSYETSRQVLNRSFVQLETSYGLVQCKLGFLDGRLIKVVPEYEDMKGLALLHQLPFSTVYQACLAVAEQYKRENGHEVTSEKSVTKWKRNQH